MACATYGKYRHCAPRQRPAAHLTPGPLCTDCGLLVAIESCQGLSEDLRGVPDGFERATREEVERLSRRDTGSQHELRGSSDKAARGCSASFRLRQGGPEGIDQMETTRLSSRCSFPFMPWQLRGFLQAELVLIAEDVCAECVLFDVCLLNVFLTLLLDDGIGCASWVRESERARRQRMKNMQERRSHDHGGM